MPAFKYKPLPSSHHVRLLTLEPSIERSAPLHCQLRSVVLSEPTQYESLSYTWDGQSPARTIRCNGRTLHVTQNVECALRDLRYSFAPRHLWIDAICIDQSNFRERALQVPLMDQIYRRASTVLVWLGSGDTNTHRALFVMRWLLPLYKTSACVPFVNRVFDRLGSRIMSQMREALARGDECKSVGGVMAAAEASKEAVVVQGFRRMLGHDWFRRIWTLQEIALARKAVLYCGASHISWTTLVNTFNYWSSSSRSIRQCPVLLEGGYDPEGPSKYGNPLHYRLQEVRVLQHILHSPERTPSLSLVLSTALTGLNPDYNCTNPKDKIFGLFGLLRALGQDFPDIDYRLTLSEAVQHAFTSLARRHNSLDFLAFCAGRNSLADLPSWVPDFCRVPWYTGARSALQRVQKQLVELGFNSHRSDKAQAQNVNSDFKIEGRTLRISGVFADRVEETTDAMQPAPGQPEAQHTNPPLLSRRVFTDTVRGWIGFLKDALPRSTFTPDEVTTLLLSLLLHGNAVRYYLEALQESRADFRLFEHFRYWLVYVNCKTTASTSWERYPLDLTQEFISWEVFDGTDLESDAAFRRNFANSISLSAIERWVREQTAQKRVFTTSNGSLGIGWHTVKKSDQVVQVPGLDFSLLVRKVPGRGADEYRYLGPCTLRCLHSTTPPQTPAEPRLETIVLVQSISLTSILLLMSNSVTLPLELRCCRILCPQILI